jgi:hypothetical protein
LRKRLNATDEIALGAQCRLVRILYSKEVEEA